MESTLNKLKEDVTKLKPKIIVIENEYYIKLKLSKRFITISPYIISKASFIGNDNKEHTYTYTTDDDKDSEFMNILDSLNYQHIITRYIMLKSEYKFQSQFYELTNTTNVEKSIKIAYQKTIYTDGETIAEKIKAVSITKGDEKLVYIVKQNMDIVNGSEITLSGYEMFTPTLITTLFLLFYIKDGNVILIGEEDAVGEEGEVDGILKHFGVTKEELHEKLVRESKKLEEVLNESELKAVLSIINKW